MIKEAKRLNQYLKTHPTCLSMSTYRKKDFDFPSFGTQIENQTLSQPYNNPYLSEPISWLIILANLVVTSLVFFFALKCLKKLCNYQNTNRIDPLHINVEMGHWNRVDITESSSDQFPTWILNLGSRQMGKLFNSSLLLKAAFSCFHFQDLFKKIHCVPTKKLVYIKVRFFL